MMSVALQVICVGLKNLEIDWYPVSVPVWRRMERAMACSVPLTVGSSLAVTLEGPREWWLGAVRMERAEAAKKVAQAVMPSVMTGGTIVICEIWRSRSSACRCYSYGTKK